MRAEVSQTRLLTARGSFTAGRRTSKFRKRSDMFGHDSWSMELRFWVIGLFPRESSFNMNQSDETRRDLQGISSLANAYPWFLCKLHMFLRMSKIWGISVTRGKSGLINFLYLCRFLILRRLLKNTCIQEWKCYVTTLNK